MDKCLQLQRQVRENSEELQDYLKDLVNWEKEIKRKEEEIKKRTNDEPVFPPIRTAHSSTKKKKTKDKTSDTTKEKPKKPKEQKESQKSGRIPGYDYRAWDLFNVDEALNEMDESEKEENKKSSSEEEEESEESENEMYELEKKKQLALIEKDKGNQFFKKGNYDMAISCYTAGIEHDPNNALLPANRAMALLKKGQLAAAEIDCTQCLILDPTYVKAYLRRGTARLGLKKYEEARLDFCKVLDLEPENNQAKLELERLQKEISLSKNKISVDSTENEKVGKKITEVPQNSVEHGASLETESKIATNSYQPSHICNPVGAEKISSSVKSGEDRLQKILKPDDEDSSVIKPIQKPPHLRSQKPMKMVRIKDVSGISEQAVPTVAEKHSPPLITPVEQKIISIGDDGDNPAVTDFSVASEQSVLSEGESERVSPSSSSPVDSDYPSVSHTKIAETVTSVLLTPPPLPTVPLTSYQFLGDWKKLKRYPELLYEYIRQFPPEKLPIVFKQSIDTELFCGILQILNTKFVENCEDVFLYLDHLRKVGRFKTLVMFLAEEEIIALNRLFLYVKSSQKYSLEEIQSVEKDYNLS